MDNLKEIIEDIEDTGKLYRETDDIELHNAYNQFIELRIMETPQKERYNLYNYWARVTR